ncbi:MarR family transcriptional regulator [Tabrizicola sp. J26]|uniref:MarR family winged helix-turn-helix transcriptional regulator n=1 Tax=Alitabrizicola rongguiensis TaxID=2909234 RepID=UPI001F1A63FB|nr:MarR family transcriptional regulator [Tabrizicola rongguiensis]MCF1709417.1 MarR family transcriptional regulator [Tabrizicola rongguiensis]
MKHPVSNLTDHTGYWMRMVSNAVSQGFARKVAAENVTVAEWVFLRSLHDEEGIASGVLAERMGMTRGAISKLADRLTEKGLVLRKGIETDRRAQLLSLTDGGRAKVPRLAALADANDAEFFGVLTEVERGALLHLLKTLIDRQGLSTIPVD